MNCWSTTGIASKHGRLRTHLTAHPGQRPCQWRSCQNRVMTFHENFWVVAGAAAPVIALANLVALNDALFLRQAMLMAPHEAWTDDVKDFFLASQRRLLLLSLIPSAANLLLQAAVLSIALAGLAEDQNPVPSLLVAVLEGIGIVICAVIAYAIAIQRFKYQWLSEHRKASMRRSRRLRN
jgi:hypothetical protein